MTTSMLGGGGLSDSLLSNSSSEMKTAILTATTENKVRKGWEFADFAECLTYHEKNATFPGGVLKTIFHTLL